MQENVLERVLSVPRSSIETVNRVDTQLLMFIAKAASKRTHAAMASRRDLARAVGLSETRLRLATEPGWKGAATSSSSRALRKTADNARTVMW